MHEIKLKNVNLRTENDGKLAQNPSLQCRQQREGEKKLVHTVHCILSDKVLRWHCSIAEPNEVECDPSGSVFFCNVPSTHCAVVCLTFGNSFSELFFLLLISNSKQPLNDENPRIPLQ